MNKQNKAYLDQYEFIQYMNYAKEKGVIISMIDGVVTIINLDKVLMGEVLTVIGSGVKVLVVNISEHSVKALVLSGEEKIVPGFVVFRTNNLFQFPVSSELLGRVVDAFGVAMDNGKEMKYRNILRNIEVKAPGIISRYKVTETLQTGIKAIDSLIPIGRGQRELIIGDKSTGKTTVALDSILNQKSNAWVPATHVHCIYVCIGQRRAAVAKAAHLLKKKGALDYSVILAATASESCALQYLIPYCATTLGEYLLSKGAACLIIYDDLSKHAVAYRQLSLLLRRFPSREAFPADVFYLHARLLERSVKYNDATNYGGSLTSLPIIETQLGDVAAYIPTNVISITDGQIFLESHLFNKGIRPAINAGLSVSRIGTAAQNKVMKKLAGPLKLELAQYREIQSLEQFGENLDEATKKSLKRGRILTELLIQPHSNPVSLEHQILIIYSGVNNFLNDLDISLIAKFEQKIKDFTSKSYIFEPLLKALKLNYFNKLSIDLLISRVLISL